MSQKHYIKKWDRAQLEVNRTIRIERPLKKPVPEKDRKGAFQIVAVRYVKYVMIYHRLQHCYDYMLHPQKRILISKVLEGVTGRIVELRNELVRVDICEYSYMGDVLADLKLIPASMEIQLSKYVALHRVANIRKRVNMLDYILNSMYVDEAEPETQVYTVEESILLIQKNERAFQARRRLKQMKKSKRGPKRGPVTFTPLEEVNEHAVTLFQALVRGHRTRKHLGAHKLEAAIALNMKVPLAANLVEVTETKVISQKFKDIQEYNDAFMTDTILATESMLENEGPNMADNMKREILQWILECRDVTGQFPPFPDEDEGGSAVLFAEMNLADLEDEMDELQEQIQKGTGKPTQKKDEKKKEKKKEKAKPPEEFEMKPSKFVDDQLVPLANEYGVWWQGKEEDYNPKQQYDRNYMLEDVTKNVDVIIRNQVDEVIRQELERMRLGIDNQLPQKPKKKKPKKGGKKGGKKKKMKDLTPGVPIEDLYKDLVLDNIIRKVPNVPISSFIGDYNMISATDSKTVQMKQDLGDVRKMAIDFGILPMSSEAIHRQAPFVKSLIIAGPHGSGKKMLVNAIAFELGANLFDLSPENMEDKYEGKKGQEMLMHLVMKVGKAMEPSVIFIGNCDLMFTKKPPPEVAHLKPSRFKKDLTKAMKFVGPEDRILLIGTTKYPFKAAAGPMLKLYQRLIFIYPPTHNSRFSLWNKLIKEHKGIINEDFDVTALSHVTRGFTAGDIFNAVTEVLTEKRVQRQNKYPIKTSEFMERIATFDPVYIAEMEEFEKWLAKTPLSKKRTLLEKKEEEGIDIVGFL